MLVVKEMWLLVPSTPSTTNSLSIIHSHQVDIELGLQSSRSMPTSSEAPELGETVDSSAPSANQVGEVTESDHMPSSLQSPELQPTTPTPVEAATSLSPGMVSGGWIDGNELPRVHTGNVQPALTDMESQEFHPAANEYLPSQSESQA